MNNDETTQVEPSEASLAEMPDVDFSRAIRPNKLAAFYTVHPDRHVVICEGGDRPWPFQAPTANTLNPSPAPLPPRRKKANSRWPFVSQRTRAEEFRTAIAGAA